jgi:hypothetical protein
MPVVCRISDSDSRKAALTRSLIMNDKGRYHSLIEHFSKMKGHVTPAISRHFREQSLRAQRRELLRSRLRKSREYEYFLNVRGLIFLNKKAYRGQLYTPSPDLSGAINQMLDQKNKFQKDVARIKENSRIGRKQQPPGVPMPLS